MAARKGGKRKALDALTRALETDRALSAGQVARHYQLELKDLQQAGMVLVVAYLAATYGSYRYFRATFVTHSRGMRRLNAASLRHLAGLAELRRLLGAPCSAWRSEAASRYRPHLPDGVWEAPNGTIAVEYDTGSYSARQVTAKAENFLRYKGQIWGTPSRPRVAHLQRLVRQVDDRGVVHHAVWH